MSVNLGFYDFFSYLIPGFLYLYVINEFLRVVGAKFIDIGNWIQTGQVPALVLSVPILLAAYVMGHIFDAISLRFFFHFVYRIRDSQGATSKSLQIIKEKYPYLGIKFESKDWEALFIFLRQRSVETSQNIDKFQAESVMLRNIAFGVLLLALLNLEIFFSTMSWVYLVVALCCLLICWISISESFKFRIWFFTNIFEGSLLYGFSIEEVIEYDMRKSRIGKTLENKKVRRK